MTITAVNDCDDQIPYQALAIAESPASDMHKRLVSYGAHEFRAPV
jgi:hypothetical protein